MSTPVTPARSRSTQRLVHARSCYDHLAGEVAAEIYAHLVTTGKLSIDDAHARLTDAGHAFFDGLGVDVDAAVAAKRPTARPCLDWTERRHHLAGSLGAELFDTMLDENWIRRGPQPRSIQITHSGTAAIHQHFGLTG